MFSEISDDSSGGHPVSSFISDKVKTFGANGLWRQCT